MGKIEIVQLLLERDDIDPNIADGGRTPLWWAASEDYNSIAQLLLTRDDLDPNIAFDEHNTPLWVAAAEGSEKIVRLLLTRDDVDPNIRHGIDGTPLWQAARCGHHDVVRLLLERSDIKPNIRSERHRRPVPSLEKSQHANSNSKTYCVYNCLALEGRETPLCAASRKGKEATLGPTRCRPKRIGQYWAVTAVVGCI